MPPFTKILIANRGEIAIRIARAVASLGLTSVMVAPKDDASSPHVAAGDAAVELPGAGIAAYLDGTAIIAAAKTAGAGAIHPGYGFLSERADFARAVRAAGLCFIGPEDAALDLFGDKLKARALAQACDVPVLAGTMGAVDVTGAQAFLKALGGKPAIIKAVAGGGGRGMRVVRDAAALYAAFGICAAEAKAAFGDGALYLEAFADRARHIEVQVIGDAAGGICVLGDRDCSIQKRNQKLIEIAPAPGLNDALRAKLHEAARVMAGRGKLSSLATFEFLVAVAAGAFHFIEANPRLQVEHPVTEAVTGIDIVAAQIRVAMGTTLADLGLTQTPPSRGHAIELRLQMTKPGTVSVFEPPAGPGLRCDAGVAAGYAPGISFDPMLAKLIVHHAGGFGEAALMATRTIAELRVEGIGINAEELHGVVSHSDFAAMRFTTRSFEEGVFAPRGDFKPRIRQAAAVQRENVQRQTMLSEGEMAVSAPLRGTVVEVHVQPGASVAAGDTLLVLEAMKMHHLIVAPSAGQITQLPVTKGETVDEGVVLAALVPDVGAGHTRARARTVDPDFIRPDLAEFLARQEKLSDAVRPEAVARRRKTGQQTARENLAALFDEGAYAEYGGLAVAAQRRRRSMEDLAANTPADGLITGIGAVNGDQFSEERARTLALAYDYTVLAGTQGMMNHKKTDRVLALAERHRLPIVWFTEGGGGRPGDTDAMGVAGLDVPSFVSFARLSGLAPRIAVNSGRCFAGNAAIFGSADITIATANSNIGMGGPAMIEGGGLGVFRPEDIGPMDVQTQNGVVDLAVADEIEGAAAARRALSYFQGALKDHACADQRLLRHVIPENRLHVYDIRKVIGLLVDQDSFLELRSAYGRGMVTGLVRIEGRPMGLIANNAMVLGGAIDAEGAEKAARFLQLCDAFDLPVLSLCDTPGFMVGPDEEKKASVRRMSSLFVSAASMDVPVFMVVLRKGYGLGAQAMAGGSFHTPFFNVAWPTGEFGGMGLEGAVRLGWRKELDAESDPQKRKALYDKLVAAMYANGKAISMASFLEIDAVIDPKDTRGWIISGLKSLPPPVPRAGKKRMVDTW
ncbi:MAG TPA: carboxyl transferase domain-containing protein [Micropepsaceae bacterium]|nr:carboxyl transferase domain-containing protein [Micropepsaceae bacterium]